MSSPVITVERLGKKYRLGASRSNERYTALRDVIAQKAAAPFRALSAKVSRSKSANGSSRSDSSLPEDFWALKDVSFEVKQGEVLGIIGRNGAGKSTLLKILSRITEPTEGRITIKGRVASLLEVGTGFHPELTGRENIFLNGAILGMGRSEIQRKFDEIVAFAEVERFLDTPVKRYSSGMYVRLAFAVAAHLEPEILIVDEVLAVGDAEFQKKCLGKMQQVATGEGRTVLFVSHNMGAITSLCSQALLLASGRLEAEGAVQELAKRYLTSDISKIALKRNSYGIELRRFVILESESGSSTEWVVFGRSYTVELEIHASEMITRAGVVVQIRNAAGVLAASVCTPEEGIAPFDASGTVRLTFSIERCSLLPGTYTAGVFVHRTNDPTPYLSCPDLMEFEVAAESDSLVPPYRPDHGVVRISSAAKLNFA